MAENRADPFFSNYVAQKIADIEEKKETVDVSLPEIDTD